MIAQLQQEILSRIDSRNYWRRFKLLTLRTRRLVKSKIRKVRAISLAWYRQQYFLSAGYRDMRAAVRRNEDIFIAICVIAIALGYAYATLASELIYIFFMTAFSVSETNGANIFVISSVAGASLLVTFAWLAAFLLNSLSIAILQGANRNKIRSARSTLRRGLRYASRTTLSWLLFLVLIALPVALVSSIGIPYISHFANTQAEALQVLQYGIIASIAGVLYVLLHYSLVPTVALYEPELTYWQVITRSRKLVDRRGKMFILAGYGLLAAAVMAAYSFSHFLEDLIGLHSALIFSLLILPILVYVTGIMTVFYRKRRLVRSR